MAQTIASGINVIHLKVFSDNSNGASLGDIEEALQWVIQNSVQYNIASVDLSLGGGHVTAKQLGAV